MPEAFQGAYTGKHVHPLYPRSVYVPRLRREISDWIARRSDFRMRSCCQRPWHFLIFFPLPQGQSEFRSRPLTSILIVSLDRRARSLAFNSASASARRTLGSRENLSGSRLAL